MELQAYEGTEKDSLLVPKDASFLEDVQTQCMRTHAHSAYTEHTQTHKSYPCTYTHIQNTHMRYTYTKYICAHTNYMHVNIQSTHIHKKYIVNTHRLLEVLILIFAYHSPRPHSMPAQHLVEGVHTRQNRDNWKWTCQSSRHP